MSRFFDYRQNNSGGSFIIDPKAGIGVNVIIEANDADHANTIAEGLGLYWYGSQSDGYDDDDDAYNTRDCPCCGDRWYPQDASYDKGDEVPSIYGEDVSGGVFKTEWFDWGDSFIHYLDGRIETVVTETSR